MKPTPNSPELAPMLAFGAHPDDIEFACGGVVAKETRAGRAAHFVVCSRGEAASHGTPEQRAIEAENSARILGATLQFIELGGDARLEIRAQHAIALAQIIRAIRPGIVLAPTLIENQHPDHPKLGRIVRDAARLARYGGVEELRAHAPHAIDLLLFYAITAEAEPKDATPLLIDVSEAEVLAAWTAAMAAHASQSATRDYRQLQLTRAKLHGLSAGVEYAIPLFSGDPLVLDSLARLGRGARSF
ncbi:MAG: PIG-L family deacetylase [Tepidisphaeraceae bacterium]